MGVQLGVTGGEESPGTAGSGWEESPCIGMTGSGENLRNELILNQRNLCTGGSGKGESLKTGKKSMNTGTAQNEWYWKTGLMRR